MLKFKYQGSQEYKNQGQASLRLYLSKPQQVPETATGGFPIQVLLVLGGMMGAVAVFVLLKTRK